VAQGGSLGKRNKMKKLKETQNGKKKNKKICPDHKGKATRCKITSHEKKKAGRKNMVGLTVRPERPTNRRSKGGGRRQASPNAVGGIVRGPRGQFKVLRKTVQKKKKASYTLIASCRVEIRVHEKKVT